MMQEPTDKVRLVAIDQALSELTKDLKGVQLLRLLERVSFENEVDHEHFDVGRAFDQLTARPQQTWFRCMCSDT